MELKIGPHGILSSPDLHDGWLDGLKVFPDNSARISCRTVRDDNFELVITEVRALRANNFREGNIIHVIWILKGSQVSDFQIMETIFGEAEGDQTKVVNLVREIKDANYFFLHIESSYGCEFKALCQGLRFEQLPLKTPP